MDTPRYWGVIPAAGQGTRMGAGRPKQYLELAGRRVLEHTLERLAADPRIAGIVVALGPDDADWGRLTMPAGVEVRTVTDHELAQRNAALGAEVSDLKHGLAAVAELARTQLGMIGKGETFYQVVDGGAKRRSRPPGK